MITIDAPTIRVEVTPRSTKDSHVEYAERRKDRLKFDLQKAFDANKASGVMAQMDAFDQVVREARKITLKSHVGHVEIRVEANTGGWKFFFGQTFEPEGL